MVMEYFFFKLNFTISENIRDTIMNLLPKSVPKGQTYTKISDSVINAYFNEILMDDVEIYINSISPNTHTDWQKNTNVVLRGIIDDSDDIVVFMNNSTSNDKSTMTSVEFRTYVLPNELGGIFLLNHDKYITKINFSNEVRHSLEIRTSGDHFEILSHLKTRNLI
jgi:hypothetical protein